MDYIQITKENLNDLCMSCRNFGTIQCVKTKCNVGFTAKVMEVMKDTPNKVIEDGLAFIPKEDTKYYEMNGIAKSIASVCRLCRECNEKHSELCSVSLARKSLESNFLKEMTDYPGNILSYIVNVSQQNPELASIIIQEYRKLD
jgi:hypothetical protein